MKTFFKNVYNYITGRYLYHPDAVIVACYYNSQDNPYRKIAFDKWYESIKHLNHRIIECTINGSKSELPESKFITTINSDSLLWHKEALLNKLISELPTNFKYVFWLDTDILFENKNWLVDGVKALKEVNLIQPFEYCVHLEKDEFEIPEGLSPSRYVSLVNYKRVLGESIPDIKVWRSYASNNGSGLSKDKNYDLHGHVGFAWGAKRKILDKVSLYDKALVGGADHIIAHAASGHINHPCITKTFSETIDEVNQWSVNFYDAVKNKISFVDGTLLHIWHGDVKKRDYYQRIKDFTPISKGITKKDGNGLFETEDDSYVRNYFERREVKRQEDPIIDIIQTAIILDNITSNPQGDYIQPITEESNKGFDEGFGGGGFSGGGAGGSWENSPSQLNDSGEYSGTTFS